MLFFVSSFCRFSLFFGFLVKNTFYTLSNIAIDVIIKLQQSTLYGTTMMMTSVLLPAGTSLPPFILRVRCYGNRTPSVHGGWGWGEDCHAWGINFSFDQPLLICEDLLVELSSTYFNLLAQLLRRRSRYLILEFTFNVNKYVNFYCFKKHILLLTTFFVYFMCVI